MSEYAQCLLIGFVLILLFMLGAATINIHTIHQQALNAQMQLIEIKKLKQCKTN